MTKRWFTWFFLFLLLGGCSPAATVSLPETPVREILLTKPANISTSEISGMDWYEDWLVMLPQYPQRIRRGGLFAIPKSELLTYLDSERHQRLDPRIVSFDDGGLRRSVRGFQGFEAIAFDGDTVYLTIEAETPGRMHGYIVRGQVIGELESIRLEPRTLQEIPLPANMINMSAESLLLAGDELLTLFEANGARLLANPVAQQFDRSLELLGDLPFPNIEYRITDATRLDDNGRFWAINYFFPVDVRLYTFRDPLVSAYGEGRTNARMLGVERLVEMQFTPAGIALVEDAPLYLRMDSITGRNWEGIVRLDERGLLVASDKHPDTILGFVPFEGEASEQ